MAPFKLFDPQCWPNKALRHNIWRKRNIMRYKDTLWKSTRNFIAVAVRLLVSLCFCFSVLPLHFICRPSQCLFVCLVFPYDSLRIIALHWFLSIWLAAVSGYSVILGKNIAKAKAIEKAMQCIAVVSLSIFGWQPSPPLADCRHPHWQEYHGVGL